VSRDGYPVELPAKCFSLLEAFMRSPGVIMSRFDLLERAWEGDYENRSNVVDQHVRALRDRIDRPFGTRSIETIRGSGYRLREDGGR
jgi:two-component system OmpR family response regulator